MCLAIVIWEVVMVSVHSVFVSLVIVVIRLVFPLCLTFFAVQGVFLVFVILNLVIVLMVLVIHLRLKILVVMEVMFLMFLILVILL